MWGISVKVVVLKILLWDKFMTTYSPSHSVAALHRFSSGVNGCEVSTPRELTQSCSQGSQTVNGERCWIKEPEISTAKFKSLNYCRRTDEHCVSFSRSVMQSHFSGIFFWSINTAYWNNWKLALIMKCLTAEQTRSWKWKANRQLSIKQT